MPDYTIRDPRTGRSVTVRGESPPTVAELEEIFAKLPEAQTAQQGSLTDRALNLLPTAGGMVGSLAGGTLGATAGGMAGAGYRQLAQHARELPGAVADVARNAIAQPAATWQGLQQGAQAGALDAAQQGAIQGGVNLIGEGVSALAGRAAPALMQSALKPGIRSTLTAVKRGDVPPVVRTLLDEGVNVTPGGLEKLNRIIGASNDEISSALAQAGGTVEPLRAASRLNDTARRFSTQVNPQGDLEAISQVGQNFLEAHPQPLTLPEAQAVKTGTYRILSGKAYGEMKGAAMEAEKAVARGLKEEIASEAARSGVDITAMNAREGAALTARDAVARRVAMANNRDPAGLSWLAQNPMTWLAAIMDRSPVVKSYLARGLYSAAAKSAGVPTELLRATIGAIASQPDEEPTP